MNEAWAYDIKKEGSSRENAEVIQKRVQEKGRNILIRTCMQMVALRAQDSVRMFESSLKRETDFVHQCK